MDSLIRNPAFHHIELPCPDLDLAEQFYSRVFGARVYMRRDAARRSAVPSIGTIRTAEESGFEIDGTYLIIGEQLRIGFLRQPPNTGAARSITWHSRWLTMTWSLFQRLATGDVEVLERRQNHILIRDPFGMVLELWPRSVLQGMGLIS
jgi:catechol 2,3-dioxygenase-like lactoylglutathione lyase family enzyme